MVEPVLKDAGHGRADWKRSGLPKQVQLAPIPIHRPGSDAPEFCLGNPAGTDFPAATGKHSKAQQGHAGLSERQPSGELTLCK